MENEKENQITPEQTEKMLKVIEGEPTWQERLELLVPSMYSIAISSVAQDIMIKSLKEANINNDKLDNNNNSDNSSCNA